MDLGVAEVPTARNTFSSVNGQMNTYLTKTNLVGVEALSTPVAFTLDTLGRMMLPIVGRRCSSAETAINTLHSLTFNKPW